MSEIQWHAKFSVSIFKVNVIQGQGKVKLEILGLGIVVYFWDRFSSKARKIILEHFLNGLYGASVENRENAKIEGNGVDRGHFRLSKYPN